MYVTIGGRWPRRFRVMRRRTSGRAYSYEEVSRHFTYRAAHRKMMKTRRETA